MNNNNIENWEKGLKDKLNSHQETTDAKDFAVFMDKLEDSGYFEEKKKSPIGWIFFTTAIIAGLAAFLYFNNQAEEPIKTPEINNEIIIYKPIDSTPQVEEKVITTVEKPIAKNVTKPKKQKVKQSQEAPSVIENAPTKTEQNTTEEETPIHVPDTTQPTTIDSVFVKPAPKPQRKRKPIIIMTTDTTVVTDTSHVKHRKKNKKKKK